MSLSRERINEILYPFSLFCGKSRLPCSHDPNVNEEMIKAMTDSIVTTAGDCQAHKAP